MLGGSRDIGKNKRHSDSNTSENNARSPLLSAQLNANRTLTIHFDHPYLKIYINIDSYQRKSNPVSLLLDGVDALPAHEQEEDPGEGDYEGAPVEQEPSPRAIYKIIYTVYIRVRETMKELQWSRNHLLGLSIR